MASREEAGGGAPKLSSSVKLVLLGEAAVGKVGSSRSLARFLDCCCMRRRSERASVPQTGPGKDKGEANMTDILSRHVMEGAFPVDALGLVS